MITGETLYPTLFTEDPGIDVLDADSWKFELGVRDG